MWTYWTHKENNQQLITLHNLIQSFTISIIRHISYAKWEHATMAWSQDHTLGGPSSFDKESRLAWTFSGFWHFILLGSQMHDKRTKFTGTYTDNIYIFIWEPSSHYLVPIIFKSFIYFVTWLIVNCPQLSPYHKLHVNWKYNWHTT